MKSIDRSYKLIKFLFTGRGSANAVIDVAAVEFGFGSVVLKYTWEISETSVAFLDINISINGNSLSTSVHYKPTDSHSYLLHSSSHPSHVKNAIPYSQFLRLRRLCSDGVALKWKECLILFRIIFAETDGVTVI